MFYKLIKNRKLQLWLLILVGLYITVLVLFYVFRNDIIYQGTELPPSYAFKFEQPHHEYFITTPDGDTLNVLYFKSAPKPKGLIFYLHGNADNLSRWGKYAIDFTQLGYDVVMFDYHGYGKSSDGTTIDNLHRDASLIFNWVNANFKFPKIVIYGRSLGSVVATELAAKETPDLLILETPFAEFKDVVYWPLKPALYLNPMEVNLSNLSYLGKVKCRKIIFQGTEDWVVPFSSAEKLKPLLDNPDDFITIEGGGHTNLRTFELYHSKLAEVLK